MSEKHPKKALSAFGSLKCTDFAYVTLWRFFNRSNLFIKLVMGMFYSEAGAVVRKEYVLMLGNIFSGVSELRQIESIREEIRDITDRGDPIFHCLLIAVDFFIDTCIKLNLTEREQEEIYSMAFNCNREFTFEIVTEEDNDGWEVEYSQTIGYMRQKSGMAHWNREG